MAPGRRVVITGVAGHWGVGARPAARARPRRRPTSPGSTRGRRPRTSSAPSSSRPTSATRSCRGSFPSTEADTVVHCGILWYPEPGKPARALHDINVIGTLQLLAACERTDPRTGDRPRLGRDLRLRGRDAVLLLRGPGAPDAAAKQVPARHLRAGGVLLELRPSPPRDRLLHAAVSARDRAGARHAALALPVAARGPDPARVRPSPAASPYRRRDRRPRSPRSPTRCGGP